MVLGVNSRGIYFYQGNRVIPKVRFCDFTDYLDLPLPLLLLTLVTCWLWLISELNFEVQFSKNECHFHVQLSEPKRYFLSNKLNIGKNWEPYTFNSTNIKWFWICWKTACKYICYAIYLIWMLARPFSISIHISKFKSTSRIKHAYLTLVMIKDCI